MQFSTLERGVVEQTCETENGVVELDLLQLALVGGGIGDPIIG
jgi:hypothetical protein